MSAKERQPPANPSVCCPGRILVLLPRCLVIADSLVRRIRERGVTAEIIRDSDHLRELIRTLCPQFILGVCCPEEIEQLQPMLDMGAFRYRAVFVEESQAGKMGSCRTYIDGDRCLAVLDEIIASECGQPSRVMDHSSLP